MEKYFKVHLNLLKDHGHYDPHNETDSFLQFLSIISIISNLILLPKLLLYNMYLFNCFI